MRNLTVLEKMSLNPEALTSPSNLRVYLRFKLGAEFTVKFAKQITGRLYSMHCKMRRLNA